LIEMMTRSGGQVAFSWLGFKPSFDTPFARMITIGICLGSMLLMKKRWVDAHAAWLKAARSSRGAIR
jgi:hypothetical protein